MARIQRLKARGGYALQAGSQQFNPADATTYYIGAVQGNAPDSIADKKRVYIPQAGLIKKISVAFFNITGNGTTEQSTISLRVNNTTDHEISAVVDNSGTYAILKADLAIPVVAGDYFEFKWVAPTWVTNPQGLRMVGVVYVES